jgi:hypothetical protein
MNTTFNKSVHAHALHWRHARPRSRGRQPAAVTTIVLCACLARSRKRRWLEALAQHACGNRQDIFRKSPAFIIISRRMHFMPQCMKAKPFGDRTMQVMLINYALLRETT